jgi:hypothetical protein
MLAGELCRRLKSACEKRQGRNPRPNGSDYRCHYYNVLTAFPPFFLLLNPVQSIFAHWTSRDVKAANQGNADSFKPH